jgi:hypothetical protein
VVEAVVVLLVLIMTIKMVVEVAVEMFYFAQSRLHLELLIM